MLCPREGVKHWLDDVAQIAENSSYYAKNRRETRRKKDAVS
jgi:hypothetical protein